MGRPLKILALLLVAACAPSQARQWRSVGGPHGGTDVYALAAADAIYAGTPGGIYRSADGGSTWSPDEADGSDGVKDVRAMLTLPDGTIIAGSYGGGIYRRQDAAWLSVTPARSFVQALATSGSGDLYAGSTAGLMRSDDGGWTWTTLSVAGKRQSILSVAAHGSMVFAGTVEGVYRSEDRGNTWTVASLGLTDLRITALRRTPDGTLFAGTTPIYGGCSLFRSRSDGRLWMCVEPHLPPRRVDAIEVDARGRVYVSGYRQIALTDDGGNNWTVSAASATTVRSILPAGGVLLAGTAGRGLVRSDDGGWTFHEANVGIRSSIADMASTPDGLYVATSGGVFLGTPSGLDWRLLDAPGDALVPPRALLVEPDGRLLVGTAAGARRYDPATSSWEDLGPPGNPAIRDLARGPDGSIYMGYYEGVYRLQGTRWTPLPIVGPDQTTRDVQAVTVDGSGNIFAGASYDSFMRAESDSEWTQLTGADVPYFEAASFATGSDGALYAGTRYAGVLRSTDGGHIWFGISEGLVGNEDVRVIAFDGQGVPWIATYGSGVFRMERSWWTARSEGLEGAMRVTGLLFDASGTAWAGTDGGGLFRYGSPSGTARDPAAGLPDAFRLGSPYPNPAPDDARVRVDLPVAARVAVELFDLLGRRVASSRPVRLEAGFGLEILVPSDGLRPGLYLVRVAATSARGTHAAAAPLVRTR